MYRTTREASHDGAMLMHAFFKHHPNARRLRPLVANFAFRSGWMGPVVAKVGGVCASMENAKKLVEKDAQVAIFPEGLKGVGKPFSERYRLNHFGRGGFVRLARTAGLPIIPVAIVGAEETHPLLAKVTSLARPLGLPYIPVTPTFPWLGPLGLLPIPTKWTIQIGSPISPDRTPGGDEDSLDVALHVREVISGMLGRLLADRKSIIFG